MPKITEYTAPEGLGIRPTETGIESTAAAARRVGGAYSEIAQLTKETGRQIGSAIQEAGTVATNYIADAEISRGAAAFAGLMNAKTKQWRDTNQSADPNDPTVAQNYQQGLEGDLAKFKSGFITEKGQAWAEHHIEQLRNHLYAKSGADRATAAGQAVKINAETTVQGLANGAMWDATEKGLQTSLSALETSGLPKTTIEEGKKEIIARNAHGYIQQNATIPEYIKKDEYRGYIDARALKQLETTERQTRRDNAIADKVAKQQTEYTAKQKFNGDANKLYSETLPMNNEARPQLPPDAMDRVRKMNPGDDAPPAVQQAYRQLVDHVNTIAERLNKPEPLAAISGRTAASIIPKIHSGEITTQAELDELYGKGLLNTTHYNFARKELNERMTDDGLRLSDHKKMFEAAVKPAITKGLDDVLNPTVGLRFLDFQMELSRKIGEYQRAGKDPHLLMTPPTEGHPNPDYMGSPAVLQKYESNMTQQMQQNPAVTGRPPPPAVVPTPPAPTTPTPPEPDTKARRAGETLNQWLERTGAMRLKPAAMPGPTVPQSR